MNRLASLVFLSLGLFLSCKDEPESDTSASGQDTAPDLALVDCSTPLAGVDWGSPPPVEGSGAIDAELAELDLSAMDAEIDISQMLAIYRGMIAYALEVSVDNLGDSLDRDALLADEPMGPMVLGSILQGDETIGMDVQFYRRGLQQYYTCSTGMPLTMEGFQALYWDWTDSEPTKIADSAAKCGDRWLYINVEEGIYVAESRTDGPVRETEILLSHGRSDGNLTFLVYDESGELTDRSQFPTVAGEEHVVAGSPYVCMTCHLNSSASEDTWGYDTLMPTTGPCAR